MAESKIVPFPQEVPRQLELPLKWYEVDYEHGGVFTTIHRPTEDAALESLSVQARIIRKHGIPEFCEIDWIVYFKDLELQFKHPNSHTITTADVGKALGMPALDVESVLRRVNAIMELRDMLGKPALPPIPMQFIGVNRKVQKLRKTA